MKCPRCGYEPESDILERLRAYVKKRDHLYPETEERNEAADLCLDAANEIERLRIASIPPKQPQHACEWLFYDNPIGHHWCGKDAHTGFNGKWYCQEHAKQVMR